MGKVRFQVALSLDGYIAGPEQSEANPLGIGGMDLHQWMFDLEAWRAGMGQQGGEANASTLVIEEARANVGAQVMGRIMFGGGPGPWREASSNRSACSRLPPSPTSSTASSSSLVRHRVTSIAGRPRS